MRYRIESTYSKTSVVGNQGMGASSSPWKASGIRVFSHSFLLASLQIIVLSSAGDCGSINSVSATAHQSSSWLRRLGDEQQFKEPSRRALLGQTGGKITTVPRALTRASEGDESPDQPASTSTVMTVKQSGTGDYGTVQEAIDAVPIHNPQRVVIRIFAGTYREKIYIPSTKPFITLLGIGDSPPVITWNDTSASVGSTWDSGTVSIDAAHFIAKGITFENAAPAPAPGAVGAQAVAMRIGGDMAAFYECSFLGAQDTLCDWMGRHYFRNCIIEGSIDFIFGNGQSLYEVTGLAGAFHVKIPFGGSVTAHYRQTSEDPSGYSFVDCNVTGTGSIFLGRAWGPYSRVVFSKTNMATVIDPMGWGDWDSPSVDGSVYYGEYDNFGPGANLTRRVSFSQELTTADAEPFLTLDWINGRDWLDDPIH